MNRPRPLDITRTPVAAGVLVHWRCPYSPQCTRGTMRGREDSVETMLDLVGSWHARRRAPRDGGLCPQGWGWCILPDAHEGVCRVV